MTRRRFHLTPLLAAAVALGLACGAAAAQDIQERTIKFGHLNNADHPVSAGVKRFAELLAAKSGGKLKVQEFPASTLGNEMQQQSALQGGVQEMTAPATTSLAGIVKEFGLVDLPFSVASFQQADALLDGPFGQALLAKLPEKGLVSLGYWDLGFRNVTNSKRPITRAEDLDGLKLRVIPNPVFLDTFRAFKANPVPMPFVELYGALESRAVDGQENPFSVILSNKFYEVNKFVSATNHVYAANIVLVSKRFWDRLSPTEQRLMNEAANAALQTQEFTLSQAGSVTFTLNYSVAAAAPVGSDPLYTYSQAALAFDAGSYANSSGGNGAAEVFSDDFASGSGGQAGT